MKQAIYGEFPFFNVQQQFSTFLACVLRLNDRLLKLLKLSCSNNQKAVKMQAASRLF